MTGRSPVFSKAYQPRCSIMREETFASAVMSVIAAGIRTSTTTDWPVSYTHLDVYKRQEDIRPPRWTVLPGKIIETANGVQSDVLVVSRAGDS